MKNYFPFDPSKATPAHENTIFAAPVAPADFPTPFGHAWGYLPGEGRMDKHAHTDKQELFTFYRGEGFMELDEETYPVAPGTVLTVRPGVRHTVINKSDKPLLWAAFWWDEIRDDAGEK